MMFREVFFIHLRIEKYGFFGIMREKAAVWGGVPEQLRLRTFRGGIYDLYCSMR